MSPWLLASRPATLSAAIVPVVVGGACAYQAGSLRLLPLAAALLSAVWIQIGTNLANDVFDYEKGADTAERLGPLRVTQAGLLTPAQVRRGMVISFSLAALLGLYLTAVSGWPIVAIGVASIASGVAYTGGPYPLGYNGLGDLFVLIFFGFVAVCGSALVASGSIPPTSWPCALAIGALCTAILVVNNVRDRETDVRAGKRTLVVRLSRRAGIIEYALLLGVAYLVPVALLLLFSLSGLVLLPLLMLPFGLSLLSRLSRQSGSALNPVLAGTAKHLLGYGLLLALGVALSR